MSDVFSREWFVEHQSKLLKFANSRIGKYILRINGDRSSVGKHKITKIEPSAIHWNQDGKHYAEFRTNNKFALRLYHAFKPLWHVLHAWDMAIANNLAPQLNAGFDTFYPDANPESTTFDGWASRSSSSTWASLISSAGNNSNDSQSQSSAIEIQASSSGSLWFALLRSIYLFDTSSISDSADLITATLSLRGVSKFQPIGSIDPDINIYSSNPSNNTSVSNSDYSTLGTTAFSSAITYAGFSTSGYNDFLLNTNGLGNINLSGISKFGARNASYDVSGTTPPWVANATSSLSINYADFSGTTRDPKLVISYIAPVTIQATSASTASAISHQLASGVSTATASSTATAVSISQLTGSDRKEYVWKVYNSDDEFLGTWNDVISELRFSHELNNPGSSIEVELARNSDTVFVGLENLAASDGTLIETNDNRNIALHVETSNQVGPGTNVDLNHRVDVVVFYGSQESIQTTSGELILTSGGDEILANIGSPNGKVLFTGYISRYISQYGNNENTKVTVLSFGDELNNYIIEDAGDTRIPYATVDPSNIVRDVLDKYNGTIVYDSTSIENTSTSVSYTFNLNTALEGVQKSLELAPQDWFWYVDLGTNILYFKDRPSTPSHYFMLGKHLESLDLEQNIEELVNLVYFQGGDTGGGDNLLKKYQDATSQSAYRLGLKRIADNRVTLAASAEIISEGEIDRYKNPRYRSTITILSDVYDIESVQLGQIVSFRNFGNFVDSLTMQIVGRQYEPDRVVLQLDTLLPRVSKRLEDIYRNLNELEALNNPDAPS